MASQMMSHVLFICSRLPYPLTGGAKVRLYNTARLLNEHHDVDLLVIDEKKGISEEDVAALQQTFGHAEVFSYPRYRFYYNSARGLVSKRPLQSHYYDFSAVSRWIASNSEKYDLVYCNHVRTTEYARQVDLPKVVDLVDAVSMNYEESSKAGIWRLILPIEAKRLRTYEQKIIKEFDKSFITSTVDKSFIGIDDIVVVPNGVKREFLDVSTAYSLSDPPVLSFLGKMDYHPNEDAVCWFVSGMFPEIHSNTGAEFRIIGSNPSKRVQDLEEIDGVNVTGFVDRPELEIQETDIFVAPVRYGAGVQNKLLEAMAAGMPIVTSRRSCAGLFVKDGIHLQAAANPSEYIDKIKNLLQDEQLRQKLGQNARERIKEHYTWEKVGERLVSEVESVLHST